MGLAEKVRGTERTGGVCAICGRALVHSKVTIEHYPFLKAVYCTEVNDYRTEWENGGEGNGNSKGK